MGNDLGKDKVLILRELKDVLKRFLGDRIRLILYGSKARGDYTEDSDIDIAIIVKGSDKGN